MYVVDKKRVPNKRLHSRVSRHFMGMCRVKGNPNWDIPSIENVSKNGCFFHCSRLYRLGQIIELEIQFPTMNGPMRFEAEVKRVAVNDNLPMQRYGTGVRFLRWEAKKKDNFVQALDFFLKKQT